MAKKDKDTGIKKVKRFPTLGLRFPRDAFSDKINESYFSSSVDRESIDVTDEPFTIGYTYKDGSGVLIQKSYTFRPGSYGFDFSVSVVTDPKWGQFDYSLVWFGLGNEDNHMVGISSYTGPILLKDGEKIADTPDDETTTIDYKGDITWGGLTNRYYTAIAMPKTGEKQSVTTRYLDDSNFAVEWAYPVTQVGADRKFVFYVGPKIRHFLNEYKNGMQGVIDYGWFDIISKPLYMVMRFFHGWFNNWGWAIIALTVVVKLAFFPLTQKSFRSMQKLQKVQPQIKKIQEAYKDDREKMNGAMMALYKEHKVNPLGGCLPMILQIPIFFALYKVLLESIELKGADFFLWIHDLSLKDPYYVTPLLMGVSMFAQQWLTPSTGDATQRKVMLALPLVFTFMFLSFPAGLVIYWLVSNVLTIVQQWVIRRETA